MMADSRIFSKIFMTINIKNNSNQKNYGMNTDSLTIWLLKSSRVKEAMFGLAKTMMVMFNLI